jgi:hypothetical protein
MVGAIYSYYIHCFCRFKIIYALLRMGRYWLLPPGLTEPVETGPETVGTGPTGSGSDRFPTGPNSKFEFEFKK